MFYIYIIISKSALDVHVYSYYLFILFFFYSSAIIGYVEFYFLSKEKPYKDKNSLALYYKTASDLYYYNTKCIVYNRLL